MASLRPAWRRAGSSGAAYQTGYRIAYGTSPTALTQSVQVANAGITRYTFDNLSPGTYYFAVRAYTSSGTESANSNVTSKVVL